MIVQGREHTRPLEIAADVAVVGSGCGGAVVARELAEAGHQVVVLEEGGHYTVREYGRFTPSQSLRWLYRDLGAMPVVGLGDTPTIMLLVGRCVGGSSTVNGGVCFRTPPHILEHWRSGLGLQELDEAGWERAFERVERTLQVARVPEEMHSEAVRRLKAAAERKGWSGHTIDRNVVDCDGCCRCIFGCPHDAKRPVLVNYLELARAHGARIYADCRVDRVLTAGGRATGLAGHVLDRETARPRLRFRVRAPVVVLSAGSVHTPLLLQASRLCKGSRQVGRNLTIHPAARVYGVWDDPVRGWAGSFQSYVVDQFWQEGIKLISIFPPPGVVAATLPGIGAANREEMERFPHLGAFGVMISDTSTGRVRRWPGGSPLLTYRMNREDKHRMLRGMQLLSELYFEAGARQVLLPFHQEPRMLRSPDDLSKIDPERVRAPAIESSAQHPLGTCRMGQDPRTSVVGPTGETHEVGGLYLADGSVVPSSVAVNPQITVMGLATRIAWGLRDRLESGRARPVVP